MPYTSSDISGMVGGQMAMFSNQAAFSHQIGGVVGTSNPSFAGVTGMQNPYQNTGSKMAGGLAMGMGGAATGISIAGGMMGGAAGWADPFTAGARGFAGATGGGGFMAGLGSVGSAFAQGGMRAGMGALAGGIGGAAVAAAPALAAGAAISYAGSQMYQGVQNMADVGTMSGSFGTQYGQPGSTSGGKMGQQTIKKITATLHELVGDDMRTTMEEIKKVMDSAGRMGMLTGISDATTFKQKFGGIVKQVRQIADIMGTTLSEAAPMMADLGGMGLWTGADVMGTAVSGRVSGAASGQMMQTMQTGAQMSHAMGGNLRAGAITGRSAFMDVQAGVSSGAFSNRDVMEFTGGVGGAEGQQMMAQRMTGIMSKFSQSSAGRLMMAGLGETEGGTFTGEIDKEKLEKFQRGELSVQDLQGMGKKSARGKEGAMSFFRKAGDIGQNLAAEGGMGAITQMVQQVADKQFGGSEQARHQLFQQMLGVSSRDAEMFGKFADSQSKIQDQQAKENEAAINKIFDDIERKQNRSWEALKTSVKSSMSEAVSRPLQEAGERLAADFGEAWDSAANALTGRVRRTAMGTEEKGRLLRGGALTTDFSTVTPTGMGQDFVTGSTLENATRGIREGGLGTIAAYTAGGAALGSVVPGVGTALGAVAGFGMGVGKMMGVGGGMTAKSRALRRLGIGSKGGDGDQEMGGGYTTSNAEVMRGLQRARMRAQAPTRKGLGVMKGGALDTKVDTFKVKLTAAIGKNSKELLELKEDNPQAYTEKLLEMMDEDVTIENLDALAIAQEEEGYGEGSMAIDFKAMSADAGNMPSTPDALATAQNAALDKMLGSAGGVNLLKAAGAGFGAGALIGSGIPGLGTLLGGAIGGVGGLVAAAIADTGIEREDVEAAMTGEGADILQKYMGKKIGKEKAVAALAKIGGASSKAAIKIIGEGIADNPEFKKAASEFGKLRGAQVQIKTLGQIQALAVKGTQDVALRGPGASDKSAAFRKLVETYKGGEGRVLDRDEMEAAGGQANDLAKSLTRGQAIEFAKSGSIGRQVAALHEAGIAGAKGELSEKELKELTSKLGKMGYDLETLGGADMKEMLKDGISKKEMKEGGFGEKMANVIKTSMTETAEARKTHSEKLMNQLNIWTEANTKFVNAVNTTIGTDIKKAEGERLADTPTSPTGDGRGALR